MSKFIKSILAKQVAKAFEGQDSALVVDMSGLSGTQTTQLRADLSKKGIRVKVVKNSAFRTGMAQTPLKYLGEKLTGVNAIVYGGDSIMDVAKEMLAVAKKYDKLVVKGGVVAGDKDMMAAADISKLKSRAELLADVVAAFKSPSAKLAGSIKGPGSRIAGILKTIIEKREKEAGETAAAN